MQNIYIEIPLLTNTHVTPFDCNKPKSLSIYRTFPEALLTFLLSSNLIRIIT